MGTYILNVENTTSALKNPYKAEFQRIKAFKRRRNMTYAHLPTKYRKEKAQKETLIIVVIAITLLVSNVFFTALEKMYSSSFTIFPVEAVVEAKADTVVIAGQDVPARERSLAVLPVSREITRYNAGDPAQTDSTPCIGAMGTNICERLAQGQKICAANFVKLGTVINIQGYGDCVVEDRMNARFPERVDIAMQAHEKPEAIKAGLKHLQVIIK